MQPVQGISSAGWWGLEELQLVGGCQRLSLCELQVLLGGMQTPRLHTVALVGLRCVPMLRLARPIALQARAAVSHLHVKFTMSVEMYFTKASYNHRR